MSTFPMVKITIKIGMIIMNKSIINKYLNKLFEITSSAAGIVGIENLHDKKVVKGKDKKKEVPEIFNK